MANKNDPEHYLDVFTGELNPNGPDPNDLLVTPGATSIELLNQAVGKLYERASTYNEDGLVQSEVLFAKTVPHVKPGTFPGFLDAMGLTTQRQYAICRIPERHACIPKPDMNLDSNEDPEYNLMCLSMHSHYYGPPQDVSNLGEINAGDLLSVTPKNGRIQGVTEKGPFGPAIRLVSIVSAVAAFDRATFSVLAQDLEATPTCTEYDENMDIPNKDQHAPVLRELWPDFQPLVKSFICECWDHGITITANSSFRSQQKQQQMYEDWVTCANGRSKEAAKPDCGVRPASGGSFHNFGMAFDFNPKLPNGLTLLRGHNKQMWENSGIPEIARSNGVVWGGDWTSYYDPIHLQFGGWTLGQLKRNEHLSSEQLSKSEFAWDSSIA